MQPGFIEDRPPVFLTGNFYSFLNGMNQRKLNKLRWSTLFLKANNMTKTALGNLLLIAASLLNSPAVFAEKATLSVIAKPVQETTYRNKTYHFSFTLPADWELQSGNASSDNALFMQLPISNSCSFQFNVIPMSATFPAEEAATTFLATAYRELRLHKVIAVKRRDTWIKEKSKDKKTEKEKIVILTHGWEITEKPQKQKQQRMIYQVYDRENRYFNFIATAVSEKFTSCSPALRKIIDSISFINLSPG